MNWHSIRPDIHHCAAVEEACRHERLWQLTYELAYETGIYRGEHYELDEAARSFETAMNTCPDAFGPQSISEARAAMSTAVAIAQLGDYGSAFQLGNSALNMASAVVPAGGSDLAGYYNDMGYIVKKGGDPDRGLELYVAAMRLCTDHNSATYASIRNNLGAAHEACGRYSEAIECYQDAMRIDTELFGAEHPTVAIRLNNIGRILSNLGKPFAALELHQNALSIYQTTYGRLHPDVAASLCYCGVAEQAMGSMKRAETLYAEALEIYERFFGFKDDRTNIVNRRLEELSSLAMVM
jgi:tetratricopeptide (TPR) repeat protein